MSTTTQVFAGTLAVEVCCNCGMHFGMPEDYQRRRREDHGWFHCPAGHSQHYSGPSELERLRDEVAKRTALLDQERAQSRDFRNAMDGERQEATRTAMLWYRHDKPRRGAYWKGYDARTCGCAPEACPYPTRRGGYRAAWFHGYGEEDPGAGGGRLLLPGPKVIEADFEVEAP